MKYLTNLRSDQGVFPFRLADVDVVVVASTQTNRKFYNIKLSRYIYAWRTKILFSLEYGTVIR